MSFYFKKTEACHTASLRAEYLGNLLSPRDGMWEAFVDIADHYLISYDDDEVGYFVINGEDYLLQFYVRDKIRAQKIYACAITYLGIKGAYPETTEQEFLSLSLDHHNALAVNAVKYYCPNKLIIKPAFFLKGATFKLVIPDEHKKAVDFAHSTLGADKVWLRGYYRDRIKRNELFGLWQDGELIAMGECRLSQHFENIADLGMIVGEEYRGRKIAQNILRALINRCRERQLNPICSTEKNNILAQKAILNSGFIPSGHNLRIDF